MTRPSVVGPRELNGAMAKATGWIAPTVTEFFVLAISPMVVFAPCVGCFVVSQYGFESGGGVRPVEQLNGAVAGQSFPVPSFE